MEAIKGFKQARGHRKGRIMYKDKDKQREANRERQRRYKAKHKGVTSEGVTDESITFVTPEGKGVTFTEGEDDPGTPKRGDMLVGDLPPKEQALVIKALSPRTKRGKDIKCFADLPPDVQQTINEISDTPEEKARRTQVAIRYQWLFPNRFYGTGPWATSVVTGKPGDADYNGICTPEWREARGR